MMTVRADKLETLKPCLKVLVPAMQQAWVDFLKDPTPMGDALIAMNKTYDTFWQLSPGVNANASALFASEQDRRQRLRR